MDTWEEGEGGMNRESSIDIYTLTYVKQIVSGDLLSSTELGALWQPKGVRWGRGFKREGTFVYQCLLHADVRQKPTQHCKAIILQLKRNKIF